VISFLFAVFLSANAFAYGQQGHQAVALVASELIQPGTAQNIRRILGNESLEQVATWPDELKQAKKRHGSLAGDAEAQTFNEMFGDNGQWHYADLPLGTQKYSDAGKFIRDNDIVHALNECIQTLESPVGSNPKVSRLSKKQALRFLVHLVGDIHQPLHLGTGYYDLSGPIPKLILDPAQAYRHQDDSGGNYLRYGKTHFDELHAFWDDRLVEQVAHSKSPERLAEVLTSASSLKKWSTPGDYHQWAEAWATDSIHEAKEAYTGIVFTGMERKRNGKLKLIYIQLPQNYASAQSGRASNQLAKAAVHLAQLLNAIHWQN
jgi:hypothetical protein